VYRQIIHKLTPILSSFLDRTGNLETPFDTEILFPLPSPEKPTFTFADLCFARARSFLATGKQLYLFYSGGLDSTTMFLSFHEHASPSDRDQIVIATTPESQLENPGLWDCIRNNYKVMYANQVLANVSPENHYIQGENADQLFGSDKLFYGKAEYFSRSYSLDTLATLVRDSVAGDTQLQDYAIDRISKIVSCCPLQVETVPDFYWWLNFSCKWQAVALRTLLFSRKGFDSPFHVSELSAFETFFNSEGFQQLAMHPSFNRWGTTMTPTSYKMEARTFIAHCTGDLSYTNNKCKIGSLWKVTRYQTPKFAALGLDGDLVVPLSASSFHALAKDYPCTL
jgi:hypothetical protein